MSRPRILLADDHTMFSQGLESLLEEEYPVRKNIVSVKLPKLGDGEACLITVRMSGESEPRIK